MYTIPSAFKDFISPDCDRAKFIQSYLKSGGVDSAIMALEGKNHIYVKFPKTHYNPMFRIKTVIAHYDRIGVGANDNSATVFCLMEWALRQAQGPQTPHNIRLIFTDGEELGEKGGVAEQGAFPLAQMFRKLGITNDDIYVFDCMGRGDVPGLAQTSIPPQVSTRFLKDFSELEQRTQRLLQSCAGGKWFTLPCSYSDNASFIAKAPAKLVEAEKQKLGKAWTCGRYKNLVFTMVNGSHYTQSWVYKMFQRVLKSAGLGHYRVHDLRHTYVVDALRAGDDVKTVQASAGHFSAAFTLDRYAHVTASMQRESAARMQSFLDSL